MKTVLFVALMAVLMYAPGENYWVRTWLFPWSALLVTATLAVCSRIRPVSLALLIGYMTVSGINAFAVARGQYNLSMVSNAAYAIIALGACFVLCSYVTRATFRWVFGTAFIAIAAGVFVKTLMGAAVTSRGVFIGNPSMTGCLLACLLPFYWRRAEDSMDAWVNYAATAATVAALFLLNSTVPWLVLAAIATASLARTYRRSIPWILGLAGIAAAAVLILGLDGLRGIEFFNDSNRFKIWQIGIAQWDKSPLATQLFGFGFGTTQAMLPRWQPHANDVWTWYHNDFLQAFMELGIAGMGILAYCLWDMLKASWKQRGPNFAILCGMIVWGVFNYPTHMAFTALFCAYIVADITRCRLIKV